MPSPQNRNQESIVERFLSLQTGDSIFVPGVKTSDLAWLRKPLTDAGVAHMMKERAYDELGKGPGVRIWRIRKVKINE